MWTRLGLVAGLLALATSGTANATVFFNSLSTATGTSASINNDDVGNSFIAGSNALSEVELAVERTTALGDNAGSVVVTLNADNGLSGTNDGPGSLLYTLQTLSDPLLTSGVKSVIDINNMHIASLAAGSQYWIEIAKAVGSGTTTIHELTTALAPTSGSGIDATALSPTFVFSSVTNPPEMSFCVSDDNSCVPTVNALLAPGTLAVSDSFADANIPEPATIALLSTGLIGLGWFRHRAKARTATSKVG
jgi:hypothetical protein